MMKKKIWIPLLVVLAVLLVAGTVLAIWLLTPKKLTKKRLIAAVNQTVALLSEGIPLDQESPYARLEEWLADREMGITCQAEQKLSPSYSDKWNCTLSLQDGIVYVQQSNNDYSPTNTAYALRSNVFTTVHPKAENADFVARITELSDPTLPSRLQLDLPEITEEDVTEAEGELIISRAYISRVLVAVASSIPSDGMDEAALAAIKTAIPGATENLGLRMAIKTEGDFLYALSLSFAANEELLATLQLPADTDLSGELLYTVKSKEESTLSLRIADRLTLEAGIQTTYVRGKAQTCHLSLDMDVKEGFVQSVYGFNGTAYSIVFCADETIRASLTVDLSSLGREERLPPLEAELLITRELGRIFVNSEETAYNDLPRNLKDVIDDYLVKKEHATVTVVQEEGQFDTITWSANMKSIPWTAAKITIYWNKAADHITLPENHLTVLENPQPYATAANDIHKFLVDAGMLDSYSGSSAVYRMDGLVLIVTVSKIGGGENATTECSFIVSDYMPGGHDEVIFKNGHYTFAYLDTIN